MAENEHAIPTCIMQALKDMDYTPDDTMHSTVLGWWGWYTASDEWYDHKETVNGQKFDMHRQTIHPARRVCREWASAILDDDGTKVGTDKDDVTELLNDWIVTTRFVPTAQRALERAFAVGTGALALWFDVQSDKTVDIRARRYDARMILPLSWDDDGISECAFVTRYYRDGKEIHQLQAHILDEKTSTYHIITKLFDREGKEIAVDDLLGDYDTGVDLPTFAIMRPAIDNAYAEGTYMGQSIFADAIDAVKGVDNAFDSMQREINVTKAKLFMSEHLFDMQKDENGKIRPMPMSPDEMIITKVEGIGTDDMYEVFSPNIRITALSEALNVALCSLGDLTGFGQNYFRFDKSGGLKTATEVSADNSAFMRNIRKHENELRPQLERLLSCVLVCQAKLNGWNVPEGCGVTVDFDDSIIQDTAAEKSQMMAEVAAGIVPKWMYLARFYAMSAQEAKELAHDPEAVDNGA